MTTELDILEAVRRALDALGHGDLAQTHRWTPEIQRDAGTFTIDCDGGAYGHFAGRLRGFESGALTEVIRDWVKWMLVGMGVL